MESILYTSSVFVFIFGTLIGSFLNVVVARYQSGLSLAGRSKCFSCGKTLSWHELFPLLSFVFQKGRCKTCKSKISWQYPLVEFLTGIIFLSLFIKFFIAGPAFEEVTYASIFYFFYALFIVSLLIVISAYDFKHSIIPNDFVYTLNVAAFAGLFVGGNFNTQAFITGVVFFIFFGALWFFSDGRAMGFGDAKLALGIGWLLGPAQGISALLSAFWLGAIVGILLIGASKTRALFLPAKYFTLKSEIPFGPFIIFGAFIAFLFNLDIDTFISLLSFY